MLWSCPLKARIRKKNGTAIGTLINVPRLASETLSTARRINIAFNAYKIAAKSANTEPIIKQAATYLMEPIKCPRFDTVSHYITGYEINIRLKLKGLALLNSIRKKLKSVRMFHGNASCSYRFFVTASCKLQS